MGLVNMLLLNFLRELLLSFRGPNARMAVLKGR